MIIICTVGRCGSSVLMEYCIKVGYKVGKMTWHNAYDAGNELPELLSANNNYRGHKLIGTKPDGKTLTKVKNVKVEICKDPQFLAMPELIKYWWSIRKDIKVLFLTRNHKSIVKSGKRIPYMTAPVYRSHTDLIDKHEKEFLSNLKELKIPYEELRFPHFTERFEEVQDVFTKLGMKKHNEDIWNTVINKDKIHV